jgi:hypothetical protein
MRRKTEEDTLRDALQDAFMAFWHGAHTADDNVLWLAYCAAQARYDDYVEQKLFRAAEIGPYTFCVSALVS